MTGHDVVAMIGNSAGWKQLGTIVSYEFTTSMTRAASAFSMQVPATPETWRQAKPDNRIRFFVDGARLYEGFIDARHRRLSKREGSIIEISGRDKTGRLVDESSQLFRFAGLGVKQLAENLVLDWFDSVSLSNARNRLLIKSKAARRARVSSEPPIITGRDAEKKVQPGERRWQVLQYFLVEAGLLAWSSADGREFIVGKPNYKQEPQYQFLAPRRGSSRVAQGNVTDVDHEDSVAERYSTIFALGTGRGDNVAYGPNVARRLGVAYQNPGNPDARDFGLGLDFEHRKVLIVDDDDLRNQRMARERAEREMAEREATAKVRRIGTPGHGQLWRRGGKPALYYPDNMARYVDEEIGEEGDFLVISCTYTADKRSGQRTTIELVPKGTDLRILVG